MFQVSFLLVSDVALRSNHDRNGESGLDFGEGAFEKRLPYPKRHKYPPQNVMGVKITIRDSNIEIRTLNP